MKHPAKRRTSPDYAKLPRNARLRSHNVQELTGWSRSTLWRRVRDGVFPQPSHDGAMAYWPVGTVSDFLSAEGAR